MTPVPLVLGVHQEAFHITLAKHVKETGHCVAWGDVKILAYESDWWKRKIKEGIFIDKARGNVIKTWCHGDRCVSSAWLGY